MYALVRHTQSSPLGQTHRDVLRPAVVPWCSDAAAMPTAYRVLALWHDVPLDAMPKLLACVRTASATHAAAAWRAVAALLDAAPCRAPELRAAIEDDIGAASAARRRGAAAALRALCATAVTEAEPPATWLLPLLHRTLRDADEHVQTEACHAWPDAARAALLGSYAWADVDELLAAPRQSPAPAVRAASARARGVLLEHAEDVAAVVHLDELVQATDTFLLDDPSVHVRAHAAWAWANACAAWAPTAPRPPAAHAVHAALGRVSDDDRVAAHIVRGLGHLWPAAPPAAVAAAVPALAPLLVGKRAPKVAWNAASCLGAALPCVEPAPSAALEQLVAALGAALRHPVVKVRRLAAQALDAMPAAHRATVPPSARAALARQIDAAATTWDEDVRAASWTEAQRYGAAGAALMARLQATWQTAGATTAASGVLGPAPP